MKTRAINPTPWLQHFNLNHGIEVTGRTRTLYLSGQTASDADGAPMHAGDIAAQFHAAWSNLKDALSEAGMTPANIVRLNIYTTDVDAFMGASEGLMASFKTDGVVTSCTLLGVARLYHPDIMIELEGTAVS